MDASKLTQKSREILSNSQSMAIENGNMYIMPEHSIPIFVSRDGIRPLSCDTRL